MLNIFLDKYKNLTIYTFSSVFLNLSSLISGFLVYKWIDPVYIGIWQSLLLIETYSTFLRMGVINGMNRELPYSLGMGKLELANKYAQTALYFTIINIIVILIIAFITIFIIKIDPKWFLPTVTIILVIAVTFYQTYLLGTYRANSDFDTLTKIQIIQAFVKIFTLAFVIFLGFSGYLLREIFCIMTITAFTHYWRPLKKVKPIFYKNIFLSLLKIGLPIFIGSYLINFIGTIPRLLLIKYGTITMLGLYAPLYTIITAIAVLPDSITTFLYPKMTFQLGKTNDKLTLWKKSMITHIGIFIIGLIIVISIYFFIPYIINNFLPKYTDSIPIINIGIFIALFMSFKFGYTTLITLKAWKLIIIYILFYASFQFIIPLILIAHLPVIIAVVYGQLITAVLMLFVSLITNYIATHSK